MDDQIIHIEQVKKHYQASWLAVDGVMSIQLGNLSNNKMGIMVYVKKNTARIRKEIGSQVEGIPIEIKEHD